MARDKFEEYLTLEEGAIFIEALVKRCKFTEPDIKIEACGDPDDNKFLELAVSENASCLVTGDNDLLVLNPF